jgi:hypothetical protein
LKIDPVFPSGPVLPSPKFNLRQKDARLDEVVEPALAADPAEDPWPADVLLLIGIISLLGITILFQ